MRQALCAAWTPILLITAACGDPCAREARIADHHCGFEQPASFDRGEQECEPVDAHDARCAIAHKRAYCDWLEGLQLDTVVDNAYTRCLLE